MTFKIWIEELNKVAKKSWGQDLYEMNYDIESFREQFDDGLSPEETWDEETYAASVLS